MASETYWKNLITRDNISFVLILILAAAISAAINLLSPLFAAVMFVLFVVVKVYQTVGTERAWRYAKLIIFVGAIVIIGIVFPGFAIVGKIIAWLATTVVITILMWGWRRSGGSIIRYAYGLLKLGRLIR